MHNPAEHHNLGKGIACGVGAGALWGLVFLAPELIRSFTPQEMACGRYVLYGLFAVAMVAPRWGVLSHTINLRTWWTLNWLSFAGNTAYYILLSSAVKNGGITTTTLVIGFLPVLVTLVGSRDKDALPLRKLLPSLMLCMTGAACIGWQAMHTHTHTTARAPLFGLLCAVAALGSWTLYAVGNSRALARQRHFSAHDWNLLTGLATGAQSVALLPLALLLDSTQHGLDQWRNFALVSAGVALLASITGNALWNRMNQLLPLTLVGQMILFETLFSLCYGFIWEQRLPTGTETLAFGCVVISVLLCVSAHRKPAGPA
ncbi:EamA family transporter [Acetobacter lambici]|uniref:DMT family transporter n=1 Tax=Acetobacter lambici TaxID=1332824 RepID=A0ABT1EZW7_9PROT|nr:DMT family transporter [Acetobacter lambici]MCP1243205.1 DMT family transporter [Acetobacter lambici]MCP1258491.1 DMT family transporter [Acetobacter lambici]NHO57194.1 EamA family transporter [Acetobacter lambici]